MMAKQLPPARFISAEPTIVSSAIDQRSATGSNRQKGLRKGSHYAYEFALEPLSHAEALDWLDLRNEADTVIVEVPQMGLEIGSLVRPAWTVLVRPGPVWRSRASPPAMRFEKARPSITSAATASAGSTSPTPT